MKKKTTTMIVALTLALGASLTTGVHADTESKVSRANSFYKIGMSAMHEGNYDLARTSFKEALRIYPKHTLALKQLNYITSNRKSMETKRRRDRLKKVIIPKVNFEKATVSEALNVLAVQVERQSNSKVTPNFIVQDPKGAFKNATVNLRLNNIPAETLLRYITDQIGGNVRYDKHATVIFPRQRISPAPIRQVADDPHGFDTE